MIPAFDDEPQMALTRSAPRATRRLVLVESGPTSTTRSSPRAPWTRSS